MRTLFTIAALCLLASAAAAGPAWVWWEGEAATETNFPDRSWFSADTFEAKRHEILSGGAWLSNSGRRDGAEAFARYRVRVPAAGTYQLWARKFWKHGPFRWRFDRQAWRTCTRDVALADSVPIRTHLVANWVHLGPVELGKGGHVFELRLLALEGEELTACFDCFLVTPTIFVPRGRLKPGETSGRTEPGWWALEPEPDPFDEAALDLRDFNEDCAGDAGFVRRDKDRLLFGDGTPVRFWGVNCGPNIVNLDEGSVTYLAKRLAKTGVNLVRFHGPVFHRNAEDPATLDRDFLGKLHFFVAAMKREGIYTLLSFYFPLWFDIRPGYGIEGYETIRNKKPFSLLFFNPRMQKIHLSWAKALFVTQNPHTGLSLVNDPAVAMVELLNEDSYLFHTFKPGETIPPVQMEKLERKFGAWLAKRYGSLAKAMKAWGGAERPALLPAWNMTSRGHGEGVRKRRASDQLRFLVQHQRKFFERTIATLREDCGAKCLFVCGNWQTADPRLLDPLERYTYMAGDVLDQHGYFGGRHEGDGASYSVRAGHRFADRSASEDPSRIPFLSPQMEGWPHIVSELGWTNPNRTRADGTVLAAAYGAQLGFDGLCFFAVNGPYWSTNSPKFPVNVPTVMGQFPGCALLFRRGDVAEAGLVHRDRLNLEDLFEFKGCSDFRSIRGRAVRSITKDRKSAAGRVAAPVTDAPVMDRGGYVTIDTPRSQGVCGRPPRGKVVKLGNVEVSYEDHASFLAVSLDGAPLISSRRLLLQFVSREKPFGFRVKGDRIADLGGLPLLVREAKVKVTLTGNPRLRAAVALDPHGYVAGKVRTRADPSGLVVEFPRDAMYVVVTVSR